MKRAEVFYVTTLANALEQSFSPSFTDKAYDQRFSHVRVNIATAGVTLKVKQSGRQVASYDCVRFAAGNGDAPLEVVVPANEQLTFTIQDLAGAAHANLAVTFFYDIAVQ